MNAVKLRRSVEVFTLGCLVVWAGFKGCGVLKKYEANDNRISNERHTRAVEEVRESRLGTRVLRDELASDFLEKIVKTEPCKWSSISTWNNDIKNPNWFSSTAGSNGVLVTCETSTVDDSGDEDFMAFKWDVSDGRGVVGMNWGTSALHQDE